MKHRKSVITCNCHSEGCNKITMQWKEEATASTLSFSSQETEMKLQDAQDRLHVFEQRSAEQTRVIAELTNKVGWLCLLAVVRSLLLVC